MALHGILGSIAGQVAQEVVWDLALEGANARRHKVTANGDVALTTDVFKFGTSSFNSDSSLLANYASCSTSDNFTNSDFVIELWLKNEGPTATAGFLVNKRGLSSQISFSLTHAGGLLQFSYTTNGSSFISKTFTLATIPTGAWHKIAIARDGTNLRAYYDANQIGSTESMGTDTVYSSTSPIRIGGDSFNDASVVGQIDECRISIGTNRGYTGATITPETEAFTADANTIFLSHFEGTDASTRILDSAKPAYGVESPAITPIVIDSSGNELDATIQGASVLYDPQTDKLTFNGADYLSAAGVNQTQRFTVYTKANVTTDTIVKSMFGDLNAHGGLIANFAYCNAGTLLNGSTDRSGTEVTFAFDFNGANSAIYIDGAAAVTGNAGTATLADLGWGAKSTGADPCAMTAKNIFIKSGAYSSAANAEVMAA